MTPPVLRLLADDLTGALDTAAELTGLCGAVKVAWDGADARAGSLAFDSGTREVARDAAVARVRALAPVLGGADIAFKKIDSLLRGHVAAELAACLAQGAWAHCIVTPAFPAQGRIVRDGRVLARQPDGGWSETGAELFAAMQAEGLRPLRGDPGAVLPRGVSVFDAAVESDLARIAALGRAADAPVLWCGSGGLARALAAAAPAAPVTALRLPVLGLFGSDQAATSRQLAACAACRVHVAEGDGDAAARVVEMLRARGVALVSIDLPPGLDRAEAALRIAAAMNGLTRSLTPPGTLLAAGGETLRAVCEGLGARWLEATGAVAPGVPRSVMRGGAWDGVDIVSKSGAFGGDTLWRDLLAANGLPVGSTEA